MTKNRQQGMRNFQLLMLSLIFLSCKNESQNKEGKPYLSPKVTKSISYQSEEKPEKCNSINKTSYVFEINGIECYWQFIAKSYNGKDGNGKMLLINQQTKKIILEDQDYYEDICNEIDYQEVNKNNFKDANFDGYKDYVVFNRTGSGSGGEVYNIYLFNKTKRNFIISELSGAYPEFDSINRTLKTTWRSGALSFSENTTYFDSKGRIKYTSILEEELGAEDVRIQTYKKVVNGKTVSIKVDTLDHVNN